MHNSSILRRFIVAGLCLLLTAGFAFAQTKGGAPSGKSVQSPKSITVGHAELKRFASTLNDVNTIQVGFRKGFQQAVTKSPLGQQEFLQIFKAERTTHKLPPNLSATQKKQYHDLVSKVLVMERQAQQKMVAMVKKDGFTVSRFDAIVRAIHTDPTLAKRLSKIRK